MLVYSTFKKNNLEFHKAMIWWHSACAGDASLSTAFCDLFFSFFLFQCVCVCVCVKVCGFSPLLLTDQCLGHFSSCLCSLPLHHTWSQVRAAALIDILLDYSQKACGLISVAFSKWCVDNIHFLAAFAKVTITFSMAKHRVCDLIWIEN